MFDMILNRRLTDEDLPLGIKATEMEATLREAGYSFYALGRAPTENEAGWQHDPEYFRAGTLDHPPRGVSIQFAEMKKSIDKSAALPNINDPVVRDVINSAIIAAIGQLSTVFPLGEEGIDSEFQEQMRKAIQGFLLRETPDLRVGNLPRLVKKWPFEVPAETANFLSPSSVSAHKSVRAKDTLSASEVRVLKAFDQQEDDVFVVEMLGENQILLRSKVKKRYIYDVVRKLVKNGMMIGKTDNSNVFYMRTELGNERLRQAEAKARSSER